MSPNDRVRRASRFPRRLSLELLEGRRLLAAGSLDESFGSEGVVFLDFSGRLDFANSVAVQSDGMIVVAGQAGRIQNFQSKAELAVVRFNGDGTLDSNFGEEGIALFDFGDNVHGQANSVAIQSDDKIVVVGDVQPINTFAVIRYLPDGSLDTDFNNSGLVTSDLSFTANDVLIQPDGKIVVVGDAFGPLGFQIFLARFDEDGALDTTFGEDGVQFANTLADDGSALAIAIQDNADIVVAGYGGAADPNLSTILVARFDGDSGDLDPDFGDGGFVTTSITTDSKASDVASDEDGRIVVIGSDNARLVVARYNEDGSPDESFNGSGIVTLEGLNPVPGGTTGGKLILQPDGKIVVTASGGNDFVLVRLNDDGSLDSTFNGVGKVTTDLQVTFDSSTALALQEDGNIVVVGISGGDWAAVRYLGDSIASPLWQNPLDRFDVKNDGSVVPLDVLRIINELNQPTVINPQGELPAERPDESPYFDVDGNGFLTPLDALGVINFLNRPVESEAESQSARWYGDLEAVLDLIIAPSAWRKAAPRARSVGTGPN